MKKFDLIFSAILVPLDYLMLILAGIFVYYLRFSALVELRPAIYEINFSHYLISLLIIFLIWLIIFSLIGLYGLNEKRHFSKEISKIFLACTVGTMIIVLFIFFKREYFSSRFIILAGWLITFIFVALGRFFIHYLQLRYYRRGKGLEPILVFGAGQTAEEINHHFKSNPGLGYCVLEWVKTIEDLVENWSDRARTVSQIIQADPNIGREEVLKLIEFCNEHQIIFKYTADIFNSFSGNVKTETLAGIPVVVIQKTALDGWGKIIKRSFDLFFSSILLIILFPLFMIISVIIKFDSQGTVLVKLNRIGERGKVFNLYKFRSMIHNAHQMKKDLLKYNERKDGPLFKMKNDPRITKFGRILRRISLDELPQLFNVLKGEMSLVGPRPHEPQEVAQYQRNHKQLLTIKPGITGLAQISGRSKLSFEEESKLDIYYIENWSLMFDFQIIIKTIPVVLSRKNVF
ncbi:MAG: sugar transferase [Patescibacteria group bacterium]|nr:sugar transferase [Patescibacteria group bacterium]MDD5172886.1 sugar transferase [Patescibacteria group bacterium]